MLVSAKRRVFAQELTIVTEREGQSTIEVLNLEAWLEAFRRAWEEADDGAVARLFADDAAYRSNPFREPHRGRDAIRAYWRQATATQMEVQVRFGEPVVDRERVCVEWWTQLRDEGELTLAGALILRFDAEGLCKDLREYYNIEARARLQPPEGWGE